jgi:hypothetical protein
LTARVQSGDAPRWEPDRRIAAALGRIRAEDLRATVEGLVQCGTRHSASDDGVPSEGLTASRPEGAVASERGIGAARRFLVSRLRAIAKETGGRLEVREDWVDLVSTARLPNGKARGANVIARLTGSDPSRVVVIAGHYDSINKNFDRQRGGIDTTGDAPGADDDASGTAVVLACARALAALEPAATIEFACHTGEEQGLLGSAAHAKALFESGVKVDGMLGNDIVGSSKGPDGVKRAGYVRVFSNSPSGLDSTSRNLARFAADVADLYTRPFEVKLVFRKDRYGRGGDHLSFDSQGFPAIRFTEPREDYTRQHENVREEGGVKYGDTIDGLDFEYLTNVAKLNAAAAAELALAPAAPRGVRVFGAVRQDTRLTWTAAGAAHEAVVRDTAAPRWERVHRLPASGEAVIPEILDDVVVGIRAVGLDGRRSLAVVPADPGATPASAPRERR